MPALPIEQNTPPSPPQSTTAQPAAQAEAQLPSIALPKFMSHRMSKPMLARVAESVYWMNRYVERAEHIARLVLVNDNVLTDVGEVSPKLRQKLWLGVLKVLHLDESPQAVALLATIDGNTAQRVAVYMTFDPENPNSLLNCLTKARENARSIREIISSEMWESLNTLYWLVRSDDAQARWEESMQELFVQVMKGSFLFQGLAGQTMAREQGWLFGELAKHLERSDITCRILETKYDVLRGAERNLEAPLRNIHWMAVLKSCCAIEAYRQMYPGDMNPLQVAGFLILQQDFPRTICYSVSRAYEAIAAIRRDVAPRSVAPAERVLVRLNVDLQNAGSEEILAAGVLPYLRQVQTRLAQAATEVQNAYFLH